MREMGCELVFREEDAKIGGHWLRKVKKSLNQISVLEDLRVDCATQLLSDSARTWWDKVKEMRATKVLK
jgi:hypothetical protein